MGFMEPAALSDRVLCNTCHHEVPLSEAVVAEAVDYVVYFCGLECYDRWRADANSGYALNAPRG